MDLKKELGLFLLTALVLQDANFKVSVKLVSGDDLYDCIDIQEQPSLKHAVLKDHKIQMRPFQYSNTLEDIQKGPSYAKLSRPRFKKIGCPIGTVPMPKTTNHHHLLATDAEEPKDDGFHMAAMRAQSNASTFTGVKAIMSVHILDVKADQSTWAQIWVSSGIDVIRAGWMINPQINGDNRSWSFGFWRGQHQAGCFNAICSGFVQVSRDVTLNNPFNQVSAYGGRQHYLEVNINQDINTRNWWVSYKFDDGSISNIGYWPKELFEQLGGGASIVGFGGSARTSSGGASPPMGSGHFPDGNYDHSAHFLQLHINNKDANQFHLETLVDSPKCYTLQYKGRGKKSRRVNFLYGGPGGSNCGV